VCLRQHAAFDGEGARLAGGRWNRRGFPIVYTSATLSLAALEYCVHLDIGDAPDDLVAVAADIPTRVPRSHVTISDLPANWRTYPAPEALADLGTTWARARQTAVLVVPSVVIPHERNYLLNPAHPAFSAIRVGTPESFALDARLWKG
jgi:RES domain-containing protein